MSVRLSLIWLLLLAGIARSQTLPAGTTLSLNNIRPVWMASAKPGQSVYLQVAVDTIEDSDIVIPKGTYVEATLDSLITPTPRKAQAIVTMHLDKFIFANGYTVLVQPPGAASVAGVAPIAFGALIAAHTDNDLLFDNDTEISFNLEAPLALDMNQVQRAVKQSVGFVLPPLKTATLCRDTPFIAGSPATSDTVIPGTPGTPDITIPGVDGVPPTVIPGIPATPPTTIPGSPGTPDTPAYTCPSPPLVTATVPLLVNGQPNPQLIPQTAGKKKKK